MRRKPGLFGLFSEEPKKKEGESWQPASTSRAEIAKAQQEAFAEAVGLLKKNTEFGAIRKILKQVEDPQGDIKKFSDLQYEVRKAAGSNEADKGLKNVAEKLRVINVELNNKMYDLSRRDEPGRIPEKISDQRKGPGNK